MNTQQLIDDTFQVTIDFLIEGHVHALELRDKEMRGHARRVAVLSVELARKLSVHGDALIRLYRGALLHDIGKISIPDDVLLKPGELTHGEWRIMQQHPALAYELLTKNTLLSVFSEIPLCHHEHWNGEGYPQGLMEEEIPIGARIFTVVDVWDALISDRPYRTAWKPQDAMDYIRTNSGILFDTCIVEKFLRLLKSYMQDSVFYPNKYYYPDIPF